MVHSVYITLLSLATVAMNIAFVGGVVGLVIPKTRAQTARLIRANALFLILILSLGSVAGSLFMQYGLNLVPCLFCWWQRVFMYPIVLLAGVAAVRRASLSELADYVLVLAVPGFVIALYQHLLQMLPSGALIPCDAAAECSVRSVFEFGYITLPWMAVSAFALLILVAAVARAARS